MEGCLPRTPALPRGFATTRWTVVRAGGQSGSDGHEARSTLCGQYWYPVYAHVMRQGYPGFDAEDLTQEFFAHILRRPWFVQADQTRGRFRSFLLVSLDHFLRDRFARGQTLKRGRGYQHVPLELAGNGIAAAALANQSEAEQNYDAIWATAVVGAAFKRLEAEYADSEREVPFAGIKGYLTVEGSRLPYEEAARLLAMPGEKLKGAVHRLRRRYGEILRAEVARTVATGEDVPEELRHLRAALAAGTVVIA